MQQAASSLLSSGSRGVEEQRVRVRTMLPWVHLCGRTLFFAGSQLLLAMEDPAAAMVAGLNASAVNAMEQVSLKSQRILYSVCLAVCECDRAELPMR
jgi:hypothetical protein